MIASMEPSLSIGVAFVTLVLYVLKFLSKKRSRLPPGPPADPIIGHVRSIPPYGQDMFFYELGKIYGDVVYLEVMNQSMIILNSVEAATHLLTQRSAIYSDRPYLPLVDILGMSDALLFTNYGKEFRIQRSMMQQYFTTAKRPEHRLIQTREARVLAQNLLHGGGEWEKYLLRFSLSIIVQVGYGHQVVSDDDPYLKIAHECRQVAENLGPLGGTPIDVFPSLRFFPSWFPGTRFATFARNSKHAYQKLREFPYHRMAEMISQGTARPSFLFSLLEGLDAKGPISPEKINRIQAVSAIIHLGGTDTTKDMLSFFILAMILYPECQARAQKEIETVIGHDRLPEFDDMGSLPYLECLVNELLRWRQAAPIVPRRVMEDDVYKGMLIPKGSIILVNIRAMTLNEAVYQDPFTFDPTRYLPAPFGRGEPYSTAHFGFGRRLCPGRFLGEDNLFIAIATMLATVQFSKALDVDGKEITPDASQVYCGVTNRPKPFKCRIEPRGKAIAERLEKSVEQ